MQPQAIDRGVPRRLWRQGTTWVLEVSRLTAVGGGVFRPALNRVEGLEHIVHFFKKNPEAVKLATPALRLIQGASSVSPPSCYEVVDGEWLPCSVAPEDAASTSANSNGARAQSELAVLDQAIVSVRRKIEDLAAGYSGLLDRVSALETKIASLPRRIELPLELPPEPVAEAKTDRGANGSSATPTGVATLPAIVMDEPPAEPQSAEPQSAEPLPPDRAPEPAEASEASEMEAELPPLSPPKSREIALYLAQLVGKDVPLEPAERSLDPNSGPLFMALLIGARDRPVGALLMDVEAVVRLGGALMMIPEPVLNDQIRAETPSEDCLAAASEVCSTLSGAVGQVDGNPQVRCEALVALDLTTAPWTLTPRARLDLRAEDNGLISFLAK